MQELNEVYENLKHAVLANARISLPIQLRLLPEALHEVAVLTAHPNISSSTSITLPAAMDWSDDSSMFWKLLWSQTKLQSLQFSDRGVNGSKHTPPSPSNSFFQCVGTLTNLQFVSVAGLQLGVSCTARLLSVLTPSSLHHLNVSANNLGSCTQELLEALSCLTALQSLDMSHNPLQGSSSAPLGPSIAHMKALVSLNLSECEFDANSSSELGTHLSHCTNLRELKYSRNMSSVGLIKGLSNLSVEVLELGSCQGLESFLKCESLPFADLASHIAELTSLREFRLLDFRALCDDLMAFAEHITTLSRLETLHLTTYTINDVSAACIGIMISHCPELQTLHVHEVEISYPRHITSEGTTFFISHLLNATQLRHLNLVNIPLKEDGQGALFPRLETFSQLKTLNLRDTVGNYEAEGLQDISPYLSKLSSLQHLTLDRHSLFEDDRDSITAAVGRLVGLRSLRIALDAVEDRFENLRRDAAIQSLAPQLPKLVGLTSLDLGEWGGLRDTGATALVKHLGALTGLRNLNLSETMIGDFSMAVLAPTIAELTALECLNLSNNNFSCDGVNSLVSHITNVTSLRVLDLCDNINIKGRGAELLAHCIRVLRVFQYLRVSEELAKAEGLVSCPYVSLKVLCQVRHKDRDRQNLVD